jgi:pilus assembly protein Flp/PilA
MTMTKFQTVKTLLNSFQADETGATAIEYAMIAGLISIVIISAASTTGTNISAMMNKVGTASKTATTYN